MCVCSISSGLCVFMSFEATVCLWDYMSFKLNQIHCFGVLLLFSRPFASVVLWQPVTVSAPMLTGDDDDGGGDGTDIDTKSTHQMLAFCLQMNDHHFFIVPLVEQMTGNRDTCQMTVHFNAILTVAYKSELCVCIQWTFPGVLALTNLTSRKKSPLKRRLYDFQGNHEKKSVHKNANILPGTLYG